MNHQVILFNGPPRSGKDTAALFIIEDYERARTLKFAQPLKSAVAALFDLSFDFLRRMEAPGSDEKNNPQPLLGGMSWRDACIWMSERCAKPALGDDFFGRAMVTRMRESTSCDVTIITDCGFQDEVLPVINAFGEANCHLFRLHREGCHYNNDSRGYIFTRRSPPALHIEDIRNNHDRDMFKIQILRRFNKIMGRKTEFHLV